MRYILLMAIGLLFFSGEVCGQFPPPKIEAQEIEQLAKSEIPTISYCELVRHPRLYNQKFIRVHGVYAEVGGEYSNLYDPSCLNKPTPEEKLEAMTQTWVWFDESYQTQTKPGVLKVFGQLRYFEHRADVVVVGKFFGSEKHGGYGHLNSGRFMLDVIRIEEAKPVKSKAN